MDASEWRIIRAVCVGALVAGVSSVPYFWTPDSATQFDWVLAVVSAFFLPGLFVSTIFSGNVHDGRLESALALNLVLYSGLIWLLLRHLARRAELATPAADDGD